MRARSYFGYNAAEGSMVVDLGQDDVRQDAPLAFTRALDDGRRGFVAARFDAEDDHEAGRGVMDIGSGLGERSTSPMPLDPDNRLCN
jgi:hypothetical protein